jgi:hypothetical protein
MKIPQYFCHGRQTIFLSIALSISLLSHAETVTALTQPLLSCEVAYAGTTHKIDTHISVDPYIAPLHDIGGRFQFKAVMKGTQTKIEYIKLYAYLQGNELDIPIHQATYKKPIHISKNRRSLTPMNHLYAGEVEREMQYQCFLGWTKK